MISSAGGTGRPVELIRLRSRPAAGFIRLVGAIPLEQSDEWATQRSRDMTLETIGTVSNTPNVSLSAVTA